jgi:N-acetylglucosaminyldiphosphoundecaprenol N-acetyl-beta-D-mannosaminyltransferase
MSESFSALEGKPLDVSSDLGGNEVAAAPRLEIVGFKVSALSFQGNLDLITHAALAGRGMWVMTLNLEMVARAAIDSSYRMLTESVDLIVGDGMPILWLSRLDRRRPHIAGRTSGIDLTEHLLKHFPGRMGILGGQAPRLALERLEVDPARIAFVEDGPVRPGELASVIAALNATHCQILFVALGVPKQDFVCRTLRAACPGLVCIGVGGTFEILAGLLPRAPQWVRNCGLEWFFRLMNEPLRLWRRYLLLYPRALPAIVRWTRATTKAYGDHPYHRRSGTDTARSQATSDEAPAGETLTKQRTTPTS